MADPSKKLARFGRLLALAALAVVLGWFAWARLTYPSDRTPEGAYLRVMMAVNRGRTQDLFPYLETRAQHACYTVRDYRKKARARVLEAYPEPERTRLSQKFAVFADAPDGADVFAEYARSRGWITRLRRDLSGVATIEQHGARATVQTVRGTRYPFRVRSENGIWGLTLFTAELAAEAERAARDFQMIDKAAADYQRVGK